METTESELDEPVSEASRGTPERRCLGCGIRARQEKLVRFRLEEGHGLPRVVIDTGRSRLGRGAYLCPQQACLDRALRRRAFQRAFRKSVIAEPQELNEILRGLMEEATGPMAGE